MYIHRDHAIKAISTLVSERVFFICFDENGDCPQNLREIIERMEELNGGDALNSIFETNCLAKTLVDEYFSGEGIGPGSYHIHSRIEDKQRYLSFNEIALLKKRCVIDLEKRIFSHFMFEFGFVWETER